MVAIKHQSKEQKLVSLYESYDREGRLGEFTENLSEGFRSRQYKPEDFDLGRLWEACFGWESFRQCRASREPLANLTFQESAGAVATSSFSHITKQIIYSTFMEVLMSEDYPFQNLIPTVPTEFNGERIPGITQLGDVVAVRGETEAYPLAGVTEDYIDTPPTKDRGLIVPVTKEAIFFNRTGSLLLERVRDVARAAAINKEKRAIDAVIDENAGAVSASNGGHRYHWRGDSIATYGDNTGTHSWDNLTASNALVDWTDLDAAEQTLNTITDPHTGEPVEIEPTHLIVTKQLEQTARRIISATEIRVATPGYATSGNPTQTIMSNPYANKYQVLSTRLLAARLATDTSWFLANFRAWRYMENWPTEVMQAPSNSHDEFHRNIVQQYRVSERGAYTTVEPRLAHKSTA